MRVSPLLRFVYLALWLCAGAAWAQDDALYEGESMVDSQSEEQRAAALPRALGQVLVKVTGDPAAASDPAFQGALGRAAGMVQQYRYREDVVTHYANMEAFSEPEVFGDEWTPAAAPATASQAETTQ